MHFSIISSKYFAAVICAIAAMKISAHDANEMCS